MQLNTRHEKISMTHMARWSIACVAGVLLLIGCSSPGNNQVGSLTPTGPFTDYDHVVFEKVQKQWVYLIDHVGLYGRAGTVQVQFSMLYDGSVQNVCVTSNSVGEIYGLYCVKAIQDAAPFDPLPVDLHKLVGDEPREANFTFYY